jgi:hypothetical protein
LIFILTDFAPDFSAYRIEHQVRRSEPGGQGGQLFKWISILRPVKIEGRHLTIEDVDVLDGTQPLDKNPSSLSLIQEKTTTGLRARFRIEKSRGRSQVRRPALRRPK